MEVKSERGMRLREVTGIKRVRCRDNTLQRGVLREGAEYTVWDETDLCYVLDGLGPFDKHRFEVVKEASE